MSNTKILPAIIPQSIDDLRASLMLVKPFTQQVQVDIVDGMFVPPISWPYVEKGNIDDIQKYSATFIIEVDLMVETPEEVLEAYLKAGIQKFIVHLEGVKNYNKLICLKHEYGYELGLSICNDTPMEVLLEHIGDADYVQFMGIKEIGSQGNPFDERVLDRISAVRKAYPGLTIAVDGSVNKKTLPALTKAGADRFAVGSAIVGAKDPRKAFETLSNLANT